ncbi:MAG: bacillithiol system redox-active protein YtxJ [Rhodothermales bacterium]
MSLIKLDTQSVFQQALERSEETPVVLYKHSVTCPVSAAANREIEQFAASEEAPVFKLVVQKSRDLSAEIEATLDVRHETPQAIVLLHGKPVFDASHHRVKAEALRETLEEVRV